MIISDSLIVAQVDKELAEKKQTLVNNKIAIEKLKIEILELSGNTNTSGSGRFVNDIFIERAIITKRQEIIDLEVQIASKRIDIRRLEEGKTDEIINLEIEYKTATSELKKVLTKKAQYQLIAPINGIVRAVKMFPGVNTSTEANATDNSIMIEDNNAVLVIVKLGQKDIVKVKQNAPINILLDTFPDLTFTGVVSEISSSPDEGTTGGEAQYEVRIVFDRSGHAVYSGMSAKIEIPLGDRKDVLFVPLTAISNDTKTGINTVTVITRQGEEVRQVELGITDNNRVEILS